MKWAHLLDKAIRQDQGSPSTFGQRHDAAHSRIQKCVNSAAGIESVEHTDPPHAFGLLRARREWPCGYSAAEKCDEVPPPHGLTPRPGSRRTITGLEWVGGVHHSKKGRPMSAMGYPRPRVKAAPRRLSALPESDLHKSRCDPPLRAIRVLTHRRIRRFSSLLIEVLGWRHVSRRRDTVAALTDAGVALINNDRRRR